MDTHTLIVTAANRPGVLARITGMLATRDYDFDSIMGTAADRPDLCRIYLSVRGGRERIEQICKQLDKLIDTVKIVDIEHREGAVVREYVLATVSAGRRRPEIFRLIELFKANLVEVSARSITIDLVGPPRRVDRFLDLLRPYGLRDFARSGYIAVRQHDRKETHHVRSNVLR